MADPSHFPGRSLGRGDSSTSEHWKEIDLTPEGELAEPGEDSDGDPEASIAARLRPFLGPGLVAGAFLLVMPIGYGFAVFAALVVGAIFYLTRSRVAFGKAGQDDI